MKEGQLCRALVVDDNPADRLVLERTLSAHGWQVRAAADGSRAFALFETVSFEVVLCEFELRDGWTAMTLLERMRASNRSERLVVVTAYGTQERCRQAFLLGAFDFLEKPVPELVLLAALAEERTTLAHDRPSGGDQIGNVPHGAWRVRVFFRELEIRFRDPRLSIAALARAADISLEHLCREVRRLTGKSPREHLHEIRICMAERLLRTTALPIKVIARECGYHDATGLERQFQHRHGCSPTHFRAGVAATSSNADRYQP